MAHTRTIAALLALLSLSPAVTAQDMSESGSIDDDRQTKQAENDTSRTSIDDDRRAISMAEPVVVTATRTEKRLIDAPAFANVVLSDEIDDRMYRTVPDILRDIPGIMVQKTGHGQGSPYIRGFTGFRTLMLIDGIRLNNSVFRDGPNQYWNTVDPYSIDRLEVIKGPSSVLYGSDGIGGTVNVITKGPNSYGEGWNYGGRAYGRLSSAERSQVVRGELSVSLDDTLGFYGGGTFKQFGDLESGAGRQPLTGYDELDGDFKFEYFLNDDTRLVVAHQRVDLDDAWRTHRTIFGQSFAGTTVGSELRRVLDQSRDLTYAQLHATNLGSFIDAASVSVSYHQQVEDRDRVRSDGRRDLQGFDVDTIGLWTQFEKQTSIGHWTAGVEYYRDSVDSFRRDFNADGTLNTIHVQGPIADDATYDLLGVFIQNDIPIGESLDLILGARYTYTRAQSDRVEDPATGLPFSIDEDNDSLVGSARFVYRIDEDDHWHLFGGVSQGFRAPNLSDLTRFDTARTNEIETPSPGLAPEQFIAYEFGVKTQHENLFAQVGYFYTDIDDMIIRQPTGVMIGPDNEVTKRNSGSGYIHGVEVQGNWRFHPNFTAFGSVAWQEGEVDTFPTPAPTLVREPIDRMMPLTGQVGLRWNAPDRDWWVEGVLTMAATQDKLSTRDAADTSRIPPGGTPGYAVFSLRSGYRFSSHFAITAAIENLTDENYRVHGSGVNEPGINLVLGGEVSF